MLRAVSLMGPVSTIRAYRMLHMDLIGLSVFLGAGTAPRETQRSRGQSAGGHDNDRQRTRESDGDLDDLLLLLLLLAIRSCSM